MHPKRPWRARALLLPLGLAVTIGFAGAEAAGCFDALDDCSNTLYFGPACSGAGSTGSSGSTGSTGSMSSTGSTGSSTGTGAGGTSSSSAMSGSGTGGKRECTKASDCSAAPPGPCASLGMPTCTDGMCGVKYEADAAPSQVYGSCQKNVCDSMGNESTAADNTNFFDNGNTCTPGFCNASGVAVNPLDPDAGCTIQGSPGYCGPDPDPSLSGLITCNYCDTTSGLGCTMGITTCVEGRCVPAHCRDNMQDNGETDVDCGGTTGCPPCSANKLCLSPNDCFSHVCSAPDGGAAGCQAPTCSDNVQNGYESSADCGGATTCRRCNPTETCSLPSDCASGVCLPTSMGMPDQCATPSCTDGVKNGSETGVDCGGDGGCAPCNDAGL